jgi:hypothetical protein
MLITQLTQERIDAFLKDLTELTRRHEIDISGCGCCSSPGLGHTEDKTKEYTVEVYNGYAGFLKYELVKKA